MSIENASENQVAGSDSGVDWITHQVREKEGFETVSADIHRMQEDGQVEGLDAGQDGLKQRIIKIFAADVGAQVHATHAWQLAGPSQFVESALRIEHGECQETDESGRIGLMSSGCCVIPCLGELGG